MGAPSNFAKLVTNAVRIGMSRVEDRHCEQTKLRMRRTLMVFIDRLGLKNLGAGVQHTIIRIDSVYVFTKGTSFEP